MAGPPGGERPEALLEPWPQGKLLRHAGVGFELVQALDAPVLQTVEQQPNIVQFFASQLLVVAEQVIEVPKVLQVINRMVDIQLLADPGTHSAHCAADRGLSKVQFLGWLSCACCCATTGALVEARRKLWSSAVAVVLGVVQFLDKVVVPVVQRLWAAQSWFDDGYMFCIIQGGFWKNLYIFLHEGLDSGS